MIELALTFVVIAILASMMIPKFGRVMQATRVRRQTSILAADLEQAFTLAGRYRQPMRLSCACGANGSYTVADLIGGTVRLRRTLGQDADLGNITINFNNNPVDIYPSGVSTAPLTATLTSGASTRTVTLSTAGHVRIQ